MRRIFIQCQGINPEFVIFQAINALNHQVKVRMAHPAGLGGLLWVADGDLELARSILSAAAIANSAADALQKRN